MVDQEPSFTRLSRLSPKKKIIKIFEDDVSIITKQSDTNKKATVRTTMTGLKEGTVKKYREATNFSKGMKKKKVAEEQDNSYSSTMNKINSYLPSSP